MSCDFSPHGTSLAESRIPGGTSGDQETMQRQRASGSYNTELQHPTPHLFNPNPGTTPATVGSPPGAASCLCSFLLAACGSLQGLLLKTPRKPQQALMLVSGTGGKCHHPWETRIGEGSHGRSQMVQEEKKLVAAFLSAELHSFLSSSVTFSITALVANILVQG